MLNHGMASNRTNPIRKCDQSRICPYKLEFHCYLFYICDFSCTLFYNWKMNGNILYNSLNNNNNNDGSIKICYSDKLNNKQSCACNSFEKIPILASQPILKTKKFQCSCDSVKFRTPSEEITIAPIPYTYCQCHAISSDWKSKKTNEALVKLVIAAILALTFTIAEAVGGYISSSLAVLADSAHMLSDFFGFVVSIISIIISRRRSSKKMPYGYYRAEVIGAVLSVIIIWLVTALLVYEAIQRVINLDFEINADIMMITAAAGLVINLLMAFMLQIPPPKLTCCNKRKSEQASYSAITNETKAERMENINIRAALIHCIGDIVQSLGVIVAAFIIRFQPHLKIADPICTFAFSGLVMLTTFNIMRDAIHVLMEATPKNINNSDVRRDIISIEGVLSIHNLMIWSINSTRSAMTTHVVCHRNTNSNYITASILKLSHEKFDIDHCTVQVEDFDSYQLACVECRREEQDALSVRKTCSNLC